MKNFTIIGLAIFVLLILAWIFSIHPNPTPAPEATSTPITWNPTEVNSYPDVRIALIQEVNDNPHTYNLVRVIATSTPNNGSFLYEHLDTDKGDNLYVEVECIQSVTGCTASMIGPLHI